VLQSLITRAVLIRLSDYIYFGNESIRQSYNIVCIFLIFFNNYGIIYLIAPMTLHLPLIDYFFSGIYPDFNETWFKDIGSLVISVALINAVMPPLALLGNLAAKNFLRSWDQRRFWRTMPAPWTRKKTFSAFKELYSGADFEIHY